MESARVALFDCPAFDWHEGPEGHPERPDRLRAIRKRLKSGATGEQLLRLEPREAQKLLLEEVHDPEHLQRLERMLECGGTRIDADTYGSLGSWEAALRAAGSVEAATEGVLSGEYERAFCATRPPGHHARPGQAMGFCLLNNVAVGVQRALQDERIARVAVVDFDVHHGNGTQEIFYERGDVLFLSSHQYPSYPHTGGAEEQGHGGGLGATLNVCLAPGSGDAEFLAAWQETLLPKLRSFAPDFLFISAGFDASAQDPLADLQVSTSAFEKLTDQLVRYADEQLEGRVVSTLEGGYNLDALATDVEAHLRGLLRRWSPEAVKEESYA